MSIDRFGRLLLLGLCAQMGLLVLMELLRQHNTGEHLFWACALADLSLLWVLHSECYQLPSWPALLISTISVFFLGFIPNCCRCHCGGTLTACKSNLKNIGTACEMYSTDNAGLYPTSLKQLTPNYLKTLPTCSACGRDTYSASFQSASKPDCYTFYCSGRHHISASEQPNYPQYNSTQGLVT